MQHQIESSGAQQEISMPTKVTDCIFMGDDIIAHDIEWLTLNQITHIINCAGRQSQNNTTVRGMCFLTFDWTQSNIQNIIDQNVINAIVGFIEEAKQQHGTVLVHGWHSESRPFCLIAIYFMIKYQWNIFKALEYLNSRREGTEIDQGFINQLNTLNGKLMERGLIKSKQWIINAETTDEEIVLTNTFLNSRKRNMQEPSKLAKKKKKAMKTLNWKENLSVEHVYSSSTVISQLNQTRPSMIQTKTRSDSVNSRKQEEAPKSITGKILVAKQAIRADKASTILTEMNVTKKWNQLRQTWMREKENQNNQPTQKFFGQQNVNPAERGRCSSVKQQRKQGLGSSLIMKNNSLAGKGKWKL